MDRLQQNYNQQAIYWQMFAFNLISSSNIIEDHAFVNLYRLHTKIIYFADVVCIYIRNHVVILTSNNSELAKTWHCNRKFKFII